VPPLHSAGSVRHRLPLALFRLFVAPLASPIVAIDGRISIRRSYTGYELEASGRQALAGSASRSRHSIAPLWIRQVADISYAQTDTVRRPQPA